MKTQEERWYSEIHTTSNWDRNGKNGVKIHPNVFVFFPLSNLQHFYSGFPTNKQTVGRQWNRDVISTHFVYSSELVK